MQTWKWNAIVIKDHRHFKKNMVGIQQSRYIFWVFYIYMLYLLPHNTARGLHFEIHMYLMTVADHSVKNNVTFNMKCGKKD